MATNFIQPGVDIKLATGSGLSANDPFLYGDFLPCVLMTDAETASPYYAVCRTSGVFDLSVKANNGSPSAVAVGDQIFYTAGSTPKLDKVATGKPFGVALETVDSGETGTIQVRLNGFYFPDGAIGTDDLADDAVTLAKLYAIAQGSIIVGGADNAPTALAAKTSGQILIGDGTDLKSVAMSGDVTISNAGVTTIGAGKVTQKMLKDSTYETFQVNPITCLSGNAGGATSGTDTKVNLMTTGANIFEYSLIGTQTIVAPVLAADGLLCSLDLTAAEGVEYSQGITARSKSAFVIGTDAAFYFKAKLKVADVSGVAECAVGFRKAAAYSATIDGYTDMAVLNMQGGTINIETIDDNGNTTTTDTTDTWADAAEHTLEVYVSAAGVVTYKIDGTAPSATAAFTFDNGDTVVPFLHILHDTTSPGAIHLQLWECGYQ